MEGGNPFSLNDDEEGQEELTDYGSDDGDSESNSDSDSM